MHSETSGPRGIRMSYGSIPPENLAADEPHPQPSRCTRYVQASSAVSAIGCAADIVTVVAAAVGVGALASIPFKVILASGTTSAVDHGCQGLMTYRWAPERQLEQNVSRLEGTVKELSEQNQSLEEKNQKLSAICSRFERGIATEGAAAERAQNAAMRQVQDLDRTAEGLRAIRDGTRADNGAARKRAEDEIHALSAIGGALRQAAASERALAEQRQKETQADLRELGSLRRAMEDALSQQKGADKLLWKAAIKRVKQVEIQTNQLETVNQQLKGTQALLRAWKQTMTQVSERISTLNPKDLASGIDGLTRQMEQLGLSQQELSKTADEFDAAAAAIGEAGTAWGESVGKIQTAVTLLATEIVGEKEIVARIEAEGRQAAALIKRLETDLQTAGQESKNLQQLVIRFNNIVSAASRQPPAR